MKYLSDLYASLNNNNNNNNNFGESIELSRDMCMYISMYILYVHRMSRPSSRVCKAKAAMKDSKGVCQGS